MKKTLINFSFIALFLAVGCKKEESKSVESATSNQTGNKTIIKETISLGKPSFTINPGVDYQRIYRMAWTGKKLWAITALGPNGSKSSDTPQILIEINPADGKIINTFKPEIPIYNLDFANGKLWDVNWFWAGNDQKYAMVFDAESGAYKEKWNYSGKYQLYYYLTFDGNNYVGMTNYDCGGNCQSLVKFDQNGNVLNANDKLRYDDIIFGGGYFWASDLNYIYKLDLNFNVLKQIKVSDSINLGEVRYSDEILMQLEYINSKIYVMDMNNNFYITDIK